MAYWFAGFFAQPTITPPTTLPLRAYWRTITEPFDGIGVLLPEYKGEEPPIETIKSLAKQLGLSDSACWIYLTYTCWAGGVDVVYGSVRTREGQTVSVGKSHGDKAQRAYLDLMSHFGLTVNEALDFKPFYRGFWGDT